MGDTRARRETTTREGAANVAKVTMPQLGESVAEGTIGKWLKQPGDHVDKYEPLLEVITDKVNAEVPSPFEGVLKEILAEEGATVPNNAEIAVIETADEGAATNGRRGRRRRGAEDARQRRRPAPQAPRHRRPRPQRRPTPPPSRPRRAPRMPRRRPRRAPRRRSRQPRPPQPRHRRARRRRRPHDAGRPPAAPRARTQSASRSSGPAAAAGSRATTSWRSSRRSAPAARTRSRHGAGRARDRPGDARRPACDSARLDRGPRAGLHRRHPIDVPGWRRRSPRCR